MAAKNKPYEQFGQYILFKKLETDPLGELWRAARIDGSQLGPVVALRRLTGGDRAALTANVTIAHAIVPQLTGVTFVRNQVIDVAGEIPYLAHDYAGGRSLRHIMNRARGGQGVTPNPLPLDQAIVIAEKVSLSLATTAELRNGEGARLSHGALIPQFVWIDDGGEIRVAGQQLGRGIIASFKDAKVSNDIGRYFPPEYRNSGEPAKTTDVFSMGAILYLLVTGVEPPDAVTSSAFAQTVGAARTASGSPLPDDIRAILTKSLDPDPNGRYASMNDMKQAIAALAGSGKYSATTFNLAFYLSNLLKKEMESEALDRDKESKVNIGAYVEVPAAPQTRANVPVAEPAAIATPMFGAMTEEPKKSKAPLAIAAAVLVAGGIGAGVYMMNQKTTPAPAKPVQAAAVPVPQKPKIELQPVVAQASTSTAPATSTADQQKAFEDAVKAKYQEELMKLQADYTKHLQQSQSKNAPLPAAAASAPATAPASATPEERPPSAAALDSQRQPAPQPAAAQPAAQPAVAAAQPAVAAPAPAQVSAVREGDVIDVNDLDAVPRAISAVRPAYSPIAQRQRVEGTVLLTALISETGQVMDVKVLKGVGFGLDEAATRAMRSTRFSPGMKDGKHVKTWFPQSFTFKL